MNKVKIYLTYQYYQARQHISLAFLFMVLLTVIAFLGFWGFESYLKMVSQETLDNTGWLRSLSAAYPVVQTVYSAVVNGFLFLLSLGVLIWVVIAMVSTNVLKKLSLSVERKEQFSQLEQVERTKLERCQLEGEIKCSDKSSTIKITHKI